MKVITLLAAALFLFMFSSLCMAEDTSVQKAYSLYYKGEKTEAVEMMEEYIRNNPDPEAYYFLGYAYYEMQQMDKAMDYFTKAYKQKNFYSPMAKDK